MPNQWPNLEDSINTYMYLRNCAFENGHFLVGTAVLKICPRHTTNDIPAELVQAGGEAMIDILTAIFNKIWKTGEWPTTWTQSLIITLPKERQLAAVPEL